ncbi:hypothetical protein SELMODRAFT_412423 [Selaginella moellendorffii]|uniref:Uncharacterized protein n=1 Tax=Selaginella moellendorffii TaxID=88036 RepID=D8RL38_SELML|nr:hypothetical protein SELMODRAFT_412423 [Selaginella moellendorffii]
MTPQGCSMQIAMITACADRPFGRHGKVPRAGHVLLGCPPSPTAFGRGVNTDIGWYPISVSVSVVCIPGLVSVAPKAEKLALWPSLLQAFPNTSNTSCSTVEVDGLELEQAINLLNGQDLPQWERDIDMHSGGMELWEGNEGYGLHLAMVMEWQCHQFVCETKTQFPAAPSPKKERKFFDEKFVLLDTKTLCELKLEVESLEMDLTSRL